MRYKQCACCGRDTLEADSEFDICPICGWEDDDIQNEDPDYDGGANHISLNAARSAFATGKAIPPLKRAAWERSKRVGMTIR